jgi:predicted transcriptional regulator
MKTLKVGIAFYEQMRARTLAIARGEPRPKPGDPKVWFTSPESFAKLLSKRNRALLAQIVDTRPSSLHELATASGRTPGKLSRTLKTMERYGWCACTGACVGPCVLKCPTRTCGSK